MRKAHQDCQPAGRGQLSQSLLPATVHWLVPRRRFSCYDASDTGSRAGGGRCAAYEQGLTLCTRIPDVVAKLLHADGGAAGRQNRHESTLMRPHTCGRPARVAIGSKPCRLDPKAAPIPLLNLTRGRSTAKGTRQTRADSHES
jgi:hypothetical protein